MAGVLHLMMAGGKHILMACFSNCHSEQGWLELVPAFLTVFPNHAMSKGCLSDIQYQSLFY